MRRLGGSVTWAVVLAGATLAPRPTRALSPAELSVDCQPLSGELRSSLEARARAELAMKQLSDGRMQILCASGRVSVEFVPTEGPSKRRDSSLTGEPKAFVEQILSLVHEVTTLSEPASADANTREFPREASSDSSAPNATASAPAESEALPPSPAFPPRRIALAPAQPAPPSAPAAPLQLEPSVGVCGELWPSKPLALLGPCLSFGFRLPPALRVAPTFAVSWGTAQPSGIAVRNLLGGIEVSVGEPLWLGLAAHVTWLHFAPNPELAPDAQDAIEPELALRAGYSFVGRRQSLAAALGLRTYPEYRDVRVDSGAVFRVPIVAFTASLEYRFGLRSPPEVAQ